MTTSKDVRDLASDLGIEVSTWAPGDGFRRYEFTIANQRTFIVRGSLKAYLFLTGFQMGWTAKEETGRAEAILQQQGAL